MSGPFLMQSGWGVLEGGSGVDISAGGVETVGDDDDESLEEVDEDEPTDCFGCLPSFGLSA